MENGVLGFNGERLDPASGAFHLGNGYRAYSPALMRFHCPDSLSPFGAGGVNPYAYCAGDPANRADPSGHLSWQAWTGIGLAVASLALAAFTAGTSIIASGGIVAALESASAITLAEGSLAVVSDMTAIACGAMEASDPQAAAALSWVSLACGAMGMLRAGQGAIRGIDRKLGAFLQENSRFLGKITRGERDSLGIPLGGGLTKCFRPASEMEGASAGIAVGRLHRSSSTPDMEAFLALPAAKRKRIGSGVSGVVYEAGRGWVVKIAIDPLPIETMEREAEIFRAVHGPRSAMVAENMLWMKRIPGVPVNTLNLLADEKAEMWQKTLAEVKRLQEMGIHHGDPSWNNLLFDQQTGTVSFIDFGKSRYLDGFTPAT